MERTLIDEVLQHRIEMEKLIAGISTTFINISHKEIDSIIDDALQKIGGFADVDRSYIFQFFDDGNRMDNTHEWCAEGIEPQIQNLKGLRPRDFPWFMNELKKLEIIHIPRVNKLPYEARAEKEIFQMQEIRSLINVPMVYKKSLIGFLGFDSVRREKTWSVDDIRLLKMVAEILVNALQHRQNHEKLKESEERYRTIIENSNDMIWILDTEGRYEFINKRIEEFSGLNQDYFLGRSFIPFIDKQDLHRVMDVFHKTIKGEPQQYEVSVKTEDGTQFFLLVNTAPIYSQGKVVGTVSFGKDISARKKAEEQIKESLRQKLTKSDKQRKLLYYLLERTRGGKTRALILRHLTERPHNANQLAKALNLDYKTIRHHLNVLVRNGVLTKSKEGNTDLYFISKNIEID